MKRAEIVMAGADQLFVTEDAVDKALGETGELIATLARLRVGGQMSGVYGQKAVNSIVDAASALRVARGHVIDAHAHLDEVKTQLGCKTVMAGTLIPKPPAGTDGVAGEDINVV